MGNVVKNIISNSIKNMCADEFQTFCLDFLPLYNAKYDCLERHGETANGQTRKGTPDHIKTLTNGSQIATQISVDKEYWNFTNFIGSKPQIDIKKCIDKLSNLEEIVLLSNQEIPTDKADIKSKIIIEAKAYTTANIMLFSISNFEEEVTKNLNKYYSLLKKCLSSEHFEQIGYYFTLSPLENSILTLKEYADYQRWLFEDKQLFNKPFSLSDIYEDLDCGILTWKEIKNEKIDPFYEGYERSKLSDVIIYDIFDKKFNKAIIIQGTAGSGKSSFTFWLNAELIKKGLRPVRIPFKYIKIKENEILDKKRVLNILEEAIRLDDEERYGDKWPQIPENLLLNGEIFNERIEIDDFLMCPYVFIIDGWDEVSIESTKFRNKLNEFLSCLWEIFINNRNNKIRLILTGRPSDLIDCKILQKETPIYTIRRLSPKSLSSLLNKLNGFYSIDNKLIKNLEEGYRKYSSNFDYDYDDYYEDEEENPDSINIQENNKYNSTNENYEILGHPLLTFIIFELLKNNNDNENFNMILQNKAKLYKKLADVTCEKSGKYNYTEEQDSPEYHLKGSNLRSLLQKTASIINLYGTGSELISYEVLKDKLPEHLLNIAEIKTENDISKLVVSYYFKGGHHHLGCEFAHKTFREYFLAESIVETLKEYAKNIGNNLIPRQRSLEESWLDFREDDPRHMLTRNIFTLLGFKGISCEVFDFIKELIKSEILENSNIENYFLYWTTIKEALLDIWEWWLEGTHYRIRYSVDKEGIYNVKKSFIEEMSEEFSLKTISKFEKKSGICNLYSYLDAFLGDGILKLTVLVNHYFVLLHLKSFDLTGFNDISFYKKPAERRYEAEWYIKISNIDIKEHHINVFSPSGNDIFNFKKALQRINNAKDDLVPICLLHCDLENVDLENVDLEKATISLCNIEGGNISRVNLKSTYLKGTNFKKITATQTLLEQSNLNETNFEDSNINFSIFNSSTMENSKFNKAKIANASFKGVHLNNACLVASSFIDCNFWESKLISTNFQNAALERCNLSYITLDGSNFDSAKIKNTTAQGASFENVIFKNAMINKTNFKSTNFNMVDVTDASLINLSFDKNPKTRGTLFNKARIMKPKINQTINVTK